MSGITKIIAPKQQSETRSAVERIGAFAAAARPETPDAGDPAAFQTQHPGQHRVRDRRCRGSVAPAATRPDRRISSPGLCTLIGGGKTSPDQAALFNSALVRYVDLLDSYMATGRALPSE